MKVIVITGVPGSGKSELIQREYADLECVDIKQVYADHVELGGQSWDGAVLDVTAKVGKLLMRKREPVVIEGMFLQGMPSRDLLERELDAMQVDVEWVFVHRPYAECLAGIEQSSANEHERGIRKHILYLYHKRAEAQYEAGQC